MCAGEVSVWLCRATICHCGFVFLLVVKRWGGKKNTSWGKRKASRAGRAQRVIGFTGVSPAQPLALGANGAGLDLEECVRASAFLRVSSRVDRRRVQTSVPLLLLSAADARKIGLRRRLFFFFFPRAGGVGGGPETQLIPCLPLLRHTALEWWY